MGATQSNTTSSDDESDDSVMEARQASASLVRSLNNTPVFVLAFRDDTLRVINADARTLLALQDACARSWQLGIRDVSCGQMDGDYGLVVDVKLHSEKETRDRLFFHCWRPLSQRIQLHRLMSTLLDTLFQQGWRLLAAPGLDYGSNLSTLIFEKIQTPTFKAEDNSSQQKTTTSASSSILCMTPIDSNSLALVGASTNLINATRGILLENKFINIAKETMLNAAAAESHYYRQRAAVEYDHQFTFDKAVFSSSSSSISDVQFAENRLSIMKLLHFFAARGWQVLGSADCCSQPLDRLSALYLRQLPSMKASLVEPLLALDCMPPDIIYLTGVNEEIVASVRRAIQTHWRRGLQQEQRVQMAQGREAYLFKLHACVWTSSWPVEWTLTVLAVLRALRRLGWSPLASPQLSAGANTTSTILFQRAMPCDPAHCALEFVGVGANPSIRVVDGDSKLVALCRNVALKWPKGIYKEGYIFNQSSAYSIQLTGKPMTLNHGDNSLFLGLLCILLHEMRNNGWQLVTCADISCINMHDRFERQSTIQSAHRHSIIFSENLKNSPTKTTRSNIHFSKSFIN